MKTENTKSSMIMMLRYKLERYRAMGNGAVCQSLNSEIRKLQQQNQNAVC